MPAHAIIYRVPPPKCLPHAEVYCIRFGRKRTTGNYVHIAKCGNNWYNLWGRMWSARYGHNADPLYLRKPHPSPAAAYADDESVYTAYRAGAIPPPFPGNPPHPAPFA